MATQIVKFRIIGVSPLLMHRPGSMVRSGEAELGTGRKIPTAEEEAKMGEYRNEEGVLYIDGMALRASIIGPGGGASGRKIGKRTANQSVAAGFFVQSAQCPLYSPKTKKPITTYRIDTRRVMVQIERRHAVAAVHRRVGVRSCGRGGHGLSDRGAGA